MTTPGTRLEVVNPRSALPPKKTVLASQALTTLRGKKIGLWWNEKVNGDVALKTLRTVLAKKYPDMQFVEFRHAGFMRAGHTQEARVFASLEEAKVDAVVATTAD